MGKNTLSKLQKEQYREIVSLFTDKNRIMLGDTDYVRMRETLGILEILGYIRDLNIDNAHVFQKIGSFADFDKWHKDKEREERQLSSREWKIAIVGAIIGLIPFFVTTVIPWMVSLFSKS